MKILSLVRALREQYPGLKLFVSENDRHIGVEEINVPPEHRSQGIGTKVMQAIQQYAQTAGKPITLIPESEPGRKAKLLSFYKNLGFSPNKGRKQDQTLSPAFGTNWLWKPKQESPQNV